MSESQRQVLRPHQVEACLRLRESERGMLVYYSMGLGKSFIAAQYAFDEIRAGKRPLILLNKSVRNSLIENMVKYIRVSGSISSPAEIRQYLLSQIDIVHLNGGNMANVIEKLYPRGLNGVSIIVDDAHNLFRPIVHGSRNATRFYEMLMESGGDYRIVFLTGTPFSNHVAELIPCVNMLHGREVIVETATSFLTKTVSRNLQGAFILNQDYPLDAYLRGRVIYRTYNHIDGGESFPDILPMRVIKVDMEGRHAESYDQVEAQGSKTVFEINPSRFHDGGGGVSLAKLRQACNRAYIKNDGYLLSSKFPVLHQTIQEHHDSPGVVYSQFKDLGILGFSHYLETNGWQRYDPAAGSPAPRGVPTFAVLVGETSIEQRDLIVSRYNEPANSDGSLIRLLLFTSVCTEGINLLRVRHVHIMEPYWNMSRVDQITCRACRLGSHDDLPAEQRNVKPYLYISTRRRVMTRPGIKMTPDEQLWSITQKKHVLERLFEDLLQDIGA